MGHITAKMFEALRPLPRFYVETGCNVGNQLAVAAPFFEQCFGIELEERFAKEAKRRFEGVKNVAVWQGDTKEHLPVFVGRNASHFFLLDAHYTKFDPPIPKSPFPLWDELCLLRRRPARHADVIVVDDVHTFGKRRDDLRYGDAPEWEGVTCDVLSSFFGVSGEVVGDGYVIRRKGRS